MTKQLAPIFSALALAAGACATEMEEPTRNQQAVVSVDTEGGSQCQTLFAGQTIDAGEVCAYVDGSDLVISYETANGWELVETHLWVGTALADMPQTRQGNPKIGNFPFHSGDIAGALGYETRVPLESFGLTGSETECEPTTLFAAAHAALRLPDGTGGYQTETGWADGVDLVDRGSWATFFSFDLICEDDNGGGGVGEAQCETAFARDANGGAACFLDYDLDSDGVGDFNRWGWSNGPLGAGSYSFEIYAGAGRCSLSAGTLVGTLSVEYDGSTAIATYETSGTFYMQETHLYIGNEPLARDVNGEYTVAPGQYPFIRELDPTTSDTYTVEGLSGEIYVVAHAVTCGIF